MSSVVDIPIEFLDVHQVLIFGSQKYDSNGWLEPNAPKMDHKSNHDSMFHHLAESFSNQSSQDPESKLDHLLHLACRALMEYTRTQRGIIHEKDITPPTVIKSTTCPVRRGLVRVVSPTAGYFRIPGDFVSVPGCESTPRNTPTPQGRTDPGK